MKYFAITLKKTRNPIRAVDYFDYLDVLKGMYDVNNVNFEDTKGLHCHFIIKSRQGINFKDLYLQKYGWSLRVVPIYDLDGWKKYIRKDSEKKVAKTMKSKYIAHELTKKSDEEEQRMMEDLQDPPYPFNQPSYTFQESDEDTELSDNYMPSYNLFIKGTQ